MTLRFQVSGPLVHFREVVVVYKGNGFPEDNLFGSKRIGGVLKNKLMAISVYICSQFDYFLYCPFFKLTLYVL